jgi:hypothetical protein
MTTSVSPLAGTILDPSLLVDVPRLLAAYCSVRLDAANPAQRIVFGTSGHRGSALHGSFNEAHVQVISQAICQYGMQTVSTDRYSQASIRMRFRAPRSRPRLRCLPRMVLKSAIG